MLMSIIVGVVMAFFVLVAISVLEEHEKIFSSEMKIGQYVEALVFGLGAGLAYYYGKTADLNLTKVFIVVLMLGLFYLAYEHSKRIGEWKELLWFVAAGILIGWLLLAYWARAVELSGASMKLNVIPYILIIAYLAWFIFQLVVYKYRKAEKDQKERCYWIGAVIAILLLALLCWAITKFGVFDFLKARTTSLIPPNEGNPTTEVWQVYRHDDVIKDNYYDDKLLEGEALADAKLNDYDFGLNPLDEILAEKFAKGEISKKDFDAKNYGVLTKEEVFQKFKAELLKDPAKAAACIAWWDVNMHTNLLGDFFVNYEGQEEAWMRAINAAAETWDQDQVAFDKAVDDFIAALEHANEITFGYVEDGITDQMYMYGLQLGRPTVIVMKTDQTDGWFLGFTNIVKSNRVEVKYRVNCDFQPTNCGEILGVEPQDNPNGGGDKPTPPGPSGGGDKPTPPGPSGGGGGGITPKDPNKGTVVGGNDTPTPGPNTNDGIGAQYSKADDLNSNSNRADAVTYDSHMADDKIAEKQEKNVANKPTDTRKDTDEIFSNASIGTGSGGVDVTSNVSVPGTGTEPDGSRDSTAGETGGEAGSWGGPPL